MVDYVMDSKNTPTSDAAGIYVHVPFCTQKCAYCDFYSTTRLSSVDAYVHAVLKEMSLVFREGFHPDTLYVGGGTPSVVDVDGIRRIIEAAGEFFQERPFHEITIEVNPGSSSMDRLAGYYRSGANRLNIGIQSFQDDTLKFLGRIHTARDAEMTLDHATRVGFTNIGIDLIYGIPGQTMPGWISDLKKALDFSPAHLSCYLLSFEPGTPMEKAVRKGWIHPLKDGFLADMFETTCTFLKDHGYAQYEISNFARGDGLTSVPNRSRHNQKYWTFAPYIGLGPSAHSFFPPVRSWNFRSLDMYLQNLKRGTLPVRGCEELDERRLMIEAIYLGLRQTDGIDVSWFNQKFGVGFNAFFRHTLSYLQTNEMLVFSRHRCTLTLLGMRFLDRIAGLFVSRELEDDPDAGIPP